MSRNVCLPSVALTLACLLFSSCKVTESLTLADLRSHPPANVRLHLRDGRILEMDVLIVAGRQIYGRGLEISGVLERPFTGSIPVHGVVGIESRGRRNPALYIAAFAGGVFLLTYFLSGSSSETPVTFIR